MQRAMGRQAEAEREKRAKIIHAEGEYSAAQQLAAAAGTLSEQAGGIQLRYLQTLTEISVEKNSTIIFPVPIEFIGAFDSVLKAQTVRDELDSREIGE
jgi:regulator of protease activity HflC (stomatin/prohibitin superfamily)